MQLHFSKFYTHHQETNNTSKQHDNEACNSNRNGEYSDPNVEVALSEQRAEMIVQVECYFVHLVCVGIHWKHTPSTVSDLHVDKQNTNTVTSNAINKVVTERRH